MSNWPALDARQQLLTTLIARATAPAHELVLVTADDKQSKLSHHFPDLATRYLGPA